MCEYCEGGDILYQETLYEKIYIANYGKRKGLMVESEPHCPQYVDCSSKNAPRRSMFFIDYCPACGRKLSTD